MKRILKYLPHLIKSFRFCLAYFPFRKALKFPVLIHRKVQLKSIKGRLKLGSYQTGNVKIGFPGSEIGSFNDITVINFEKDAIITLGANIIFGSGSRLSIKGELTVGNNFIASMNSWIICEKEIHFGDDVLISWNTQILDTDQHYLSKDGFLISNKGTIEIGNHVWIASNVTILKRSSVAHGSIIASGSIINQSFKEPRCIIGGIPGQIIKENIDWSIDKFE